MKNKRILNAIGQIDDAYIKEAAPRVPKKSHYPIWMRWMSVAAAFVIVVGIGGYQLIKLFGGANAGGGGDDELTYMGYYGPILPLTALDAADGITAARQINYDFEDSVITSFVTDRYLLTNTSDNDQTVRLAYPIADDLHGYAQAIPTITVNDEPISTELHPGPHAYGSENKQNYRQITSWEGYQALLSDERYIQSAFDAYPELNQSIIIYEITDYVIHEEGSNPTLNIEFYIDRDKTSVMTYGMNGGKHNAANGYEARHFSVPAEGEYGYGDSYYVIMVGDDLKSYKLQGYEDGGCDEGEEIKITAKITRSESTLGEFLWKIIEQERSPVEEPYYISDLISNEMYFGLLSELIAGDETIVNQFGEGDIESLLSATNRIPRIFYNTFELVIPAGESVEISCTMVKTAHQDFVGKGSDRYGYDMVTRLGSNLVFTEQKASISNTDNIEILRQNFGFDLEKGITEVILDIRTEHYWMDICQITDNEEKQE